MCVCVTISVIQVSEWCMVYFVHHLLFQITATVASTKETGAAITERVISEYCMCVCVTISVIQVSEWCMVYFVHQDLSVTVRGTMEEDSNSAVIRRTINGLPVQ
eukprot:TRINITY_DN9000_c0_g1_i2.p1 TRINITY_DN9000_c0_g1~~TRINITY_DN9000_c0_g1_i2.p1  ORF type:complete len:104 (-),score=0.75 TRINITY_DN9000_c0_g1_i2:8-319(-)